LWFCSEADKLEDMNVPTNSFDATKEDGDGAAASMLTQVGRTGWTGGWTG